MALITVKLIAIKNLFSSFLSRKRPLALFLFLCAANALFLFNGCSFSKHTSEPKIKPSMPSSEEISPEKVMFQGLRSFRKGDFQNAITFWTMAGQLFEKEENFAEQSKALTRLSHAYQSIGQYGKALDILEFALMASKKSDNKNMTASVLSSLGNAYLSTGPAEKAQKCLDKALNIARELNNYDLMAAILNNSGNLLASKKMYKKAIKTYSESVMFATKTDNFSLVSVALANEAAAALKDGQYRAAAKLLDKALINTKGWTYCHEKAYGLIKIGLAYNKLRAHLADPDYKFLHLAVKSLNKAVIVAESIDDTLAVSYAFGYLGKIYEEGRRYEEALQFTRDASFAAQQVNSPESLYLWQWQAGRLLKMTGQIDEAISAYRRAVDMIPSIRREMAVGYGEKYSFRNSVGPLYFELVDLLLRRAASIKEQKDHEPYLKEAREKIELLKVAELRDYFQDECVDASNTRITSLDIISQTAVVIYPILLPDRIELLVSLPGGLKRFSAPAGRDAVAKEVKDFRNMLEKRISREYLAHAQKLYDWLIRPLLPVLEPLSIDTLVFVPDGPLRTIPMAALHDGKQFLIERFTLAITPGLSITDPRPISRENMKVLTLGLTEASQGFSPLPFVAGELQDIQTIFKGKMLLNRDFLLSNVDKTLQDEPFNIVHIASHGQFDSDVKKSFLLTFDDKLTLERLDQCVGLFRYREEPLELLTLSACETAAGDEKAALGLAGVAVKAGARSALATLWHINDQASSLLITEFYRQLKNPSVSRAVALQRAQLKLINDPCYEHPGYWSPFLLINNWL